MLYKEPFVLYLNISVCLILLFLALPSLLNKREELKVRMAFAFVFFVVIATCLTNLLVLYPGNYRLVFLGYFVFFISLLFGPAIYYYVVNLLSGQVSKNIYFSLIPGIASVSYGLYLAFSDTIVQRKAFQRILEGEDLFYEITNLLTLILTLFYCVKAWVFIQKFQNKNEEYPHSLFLRKIAWAREFIIYIFANVLIFLLLVLVLTHEFAVTTMDMDMIGMPVFMLFVYLLVAMRSMMMYKDFEYQFILAKIEGERELQEQRLKISGDLHDSLGAQLTFINTISDGLKNAPSTAEATVKSKINMLADLSENSILELKNTLWVLNTKEIHLQDLKEKILNFIKSASEAKEEINFNFHFDVLENFNINSTQAVNLFRTVQEIVNNALKHAHATEIRIKMEQEGRNLLLYIADNGKGFDYENEKNKSFGLRNIESRISNVSGRMNVETSADNGTKYVIQIKL
ncbi:sensor histidine kinase [Sphingobacterium humi]|uniref:histidine kinase n=1 Tax=Sphingobacterium humi TaxID=1796905 RepID=A0A6N8KTN4_9SPHI|nr:ATP-binding protein [Sphingobacterium humi]MVZ60457.1 hypothetical protein [Sphingobacterium humi]